MKLGKAFSDSISIEHKIVTRVAKQSTESWWMGRGRALLFASVFFVALFVLVWRLFTLTIVEGHRFRMLAETNRTRELVHRAARGTLYDRTVNVPQYRLTKPCNGSPETFCTERLSKEEGEQLLTEGLPKGWFLEKDYLRRYPFGETLAHVVGYVGELSEKELADEYYQLRNYRPGDMVGRMGAELVWEERLRGRDGWELVEVDAQGQILRSLGQQKEEPGEDMTLALDAGISLAAAKAFPPGAKGAVVVSKPATGEILGIYSSPSFSPDAFSAGMTVEEYRALAESPDSPMFNRAIGGVYPPGSTFKLVTALAGLEEGAITQHTMV